MARFTVLSLPVADSNLADFLMNSPPSLVQAIAKASNRIDRDLQFADLIPPYRGLVDPDLPRAHRVDPLIAYYAVELTTREVTITHYQLVIDLFRG